MHVRALLAVLLWLLVCTTAERVLAAAPGEGAAIAGTGVAFCESAASGSTDTPARQWIAPQRSAAFTGPAWRAQQLHAVLAGIFRPERFALDSRTFRSRRGASRAAPPLHNIPLLI